MDVKIDICATRRTDRWSWLNVILDELLDGVVHRLDGANARELLASDWAREASEGGSWAERKVQELVVGQYRLAAQAGGELDAPPAPRLKIEIHDETPQGGAHGLILGPIDAYKCLTAPLMIFVENAASDGEFWQTIWTAGKRERLLGAFDTRRVEFGHCGGKGDIPKQFERWFRRRPPGPLRALVLKDSDKLWPTHTQQNGVLKFTTPIHPECYTLRHREIENYLPSYALKKREEYNYRSPGEIERSIENLSKRLALESLPQNARGHYDMKSGLNDVSKISPANRANHLALFVSVGFEAALTLWEGFGANIGNLFETARDRITREALEEVCDFEGEFVPILDRIEALL